MGQARSRGTREQRIAQAVERTAREKEAKAAAERARWEALTPEQQQAERTAKEQARQRIAEMRAASAMIAGNAMQRFPR